MQIKSARERWIPVFSAAPYPRFRLWWTTLNGSSWSSLDSTATYKLVTNNYIAEGRDGYLTFKTVKNDGRYLDTYLDYAQSFVDYVRERGSVGKLPESEYSIQAISK